MSKENKTRLMEVSNCTFLLIFDFGSYSVWQVLWWRIVDYKLRPMLQVFTKG